MKIPYHLLIYQRIQSIFVADQFFRSRLIQPLEMNGIGHMLLFKPDKVLRAADLVVPRYLLLGTHSLENMIDFVVHGSCSNLFSPEQLHIIKIKKEGKIFQNSCIKGLLQIVQLKIRTVNTSHLDVSQPAVDPLQTFSAQMLSV